jgi:hypothetical protein
MEKVECLSSASYPDRPLALTWDGQRLEVAVILSRRRTPQERWFRVRTADGRIFDLTFNETGLAWSIKSTSGG